MKKAFLFVTWAGGGNVPPQLVLARRLAAKGHEVRVLAPSVLRARIEAAGVIFEPYRSAPEHDESVPERSLIRDFEHRSQIGAVAATRERLLAGMAAPVAADVLDILGRTRIDVVATDYLLVGGAFAAEAAAVRRAVLVHTVYPFPGAGLPPFGMGWQPMAGPIGVVRDAIGWALFRRMYEAPLIPRLNEVRLKLGIPPIRSLRDFVDRVDRVLVLTSPAFDFAGTMPGNVRYVGAQLEETDWTDAWEPPWPASDRRPLVAVGLSTTYQAHQGLLERTVKGIAGLPVKALVGTGRLALPSVPPNVYAATYVPHARLFPLADAVVTHAGLGTVHEALRYGRPLVCLPISRDQPDNAVRIVARGAGIRLRRSASPPKIAAAVMTALEDSRFREAAQRLQAGMERDGAATAGPDELVRLATDPAT